MGTKEGVKILKENIRARFAGLNKFVRMLSAEGAKFLIT